MREIFNPLAFFDFLTLRVILIVLVLFATSGYAQTRLISGSIIDKESGNKGLTVSYSGKYRFEVLDSSDGKESRKWVRNRELVYMGSLRHFLYAIANEELSEQWFVFHFADLISSGDQFSLSKLALEDELIHNDMNTNQQYIDFNGFIRVLYTEGSVSGSDQSQTSYLYAKKRIAVFRNGLSLMMSTSRNTDFGAKAALLNYCLSIIVPDNNLFELTITHLFSLYGLLLLKWD